MAAITVPSPKLRIICLHGYRQNDALFREKTGSLRKLFKKYADFDFVAAPHLLPGDGSPEARADAKAWWFTKRPPSFSSRDVSDLADGFEESVSVVLNYVEKNGPFDGIFGFSQGASMAHLLLGIEQSGDFSLGFRFAIFCSGFLSLSSQHHQYTTRKFDLPSLHIYGSGDEIVLKTTSEKLQSAFTNSVAIVHEGGHMVPAMSKYKDTFVEFLEKQQRIPN